MCYRPVILALMLAMTLSAPAHAMTEEEMFFKGTADVNEGALRFNPPPPDRPLHHHQNHITVSAESLASGWIHLKQCHDNLDAVPALQIVFHPERIRALKISATRNIETARIEGHHIELTNLSRGAHLCLEAESRALSQEGEGRWRLDNGPYMRKFLDGYYPMRVSMTVRLAVPQLQVLSIEPPSQPGFAVERTPDGLRFDAVFEGRLRTVIRIGREQP